MHGMNYIGRFISNFKEFYNDINGATLTGAIDVVVVEQPDGTYNCSPFHVRFGKIGVLRSREKVVDVQVNGEPLDIHMKLGESGEAFFVEEVQDSDNEEIPEHLATSPIPVDFEELYKSKTRRRNSLDLNETIPPVFENEVNDYTKRRHTANSDDDFRAKDFIKRQIGLGNIDLGEASAEDLTLSLPSGNTTKLSSEDISKDNSISETIFQMDGLEIDGKTAIENTSTPIKFDEPISEGKNGKKRRRKKSLMKKKNAQRKTSSAEPPAMETLEVGVDLKVPDSSTDRSSLDSNVSEPELRDIQISEAASVTSNRKVIDPDFHFFSDTELTSGPGDSRPASPTAIEAVLSDTEFEVKNRKDDDIDIEVQQSWAWGEFPSSKPHVSSPASDKTTGQTSTQAQHNSMLSSVFSFMKHQRQASNSDGVYLADLSSGAIEPEVAALYFTKTNEKKTADADMDYESGNGPSLTQSPNSAEGCKSIDSDFEEQKAAQVGICDISLSLCGWDSEPTEERFNAETVAFSDLCNNPSLLESPKMVVRIHDKYYNWKVAIPIITSLFIYQRSLPQSTVDQLCNMHMAAATQEKRTKVETKSYSWWGWRRSRSSRETPPSTDTIINVDTPKTEEAKDVSIVVEVPNTKIDIPSVLESPVIEDGYYGSQSSGSDHGKDIVVIEEKAVDNQGTSEKSDKSDKCRKTLRLSSEQIKSLNLRDGMNEVEFSVTTAYQGTTRCKCHIYKWRWDDKIVISDIDGTITKSDVLGHILPIVGKDWAQSGVAQLFNKIKDNGYKLLYLSARAIGQARITREYLKSIKQGDLNMPDGPMLLNPTSLITAFHREVIEKKPEQFKISCMSDIRALFPIESNPFYAGYGNRINDVWAYRAVGIPIVRIFTINHKGELKHELTQTFQSSYSNMTNYVDQLFPPLLEAANDYSQFVYWREPIPNILDLNVAETLTN